MIIPHFALFCYSGSTYLLLPPTTSLYNCYLFMISTFVNILCTRVFRKPSKIAHRHKELKYPWWNNTMESLKLLLSLIIVQFSFAIMGYAICQCCCTGMRRQVIFDARCCWLTSGTQWGTAPQQRMWSGTMISSMKLYVYVSSVLGEWHHPVQGTSRPIWVLLRLQELEQDEGEFFHSSLRPIIPWIMQWWRHLGKPQK